VRGPVFATANNVEDPMITFKHILVPTDFGPASQRAVDVALDLAAKFDAKVTLFHSTWLPAFYHTAYAEGIAWPVDELETAATRELTETLAKAKARYANVESTLVTGETWRRILDVAKERSVDLIVMGTHGRRGISRVLLGSVAEKVVRLASVPVITVPAEAERRTREAALAEVTVAH
jgi:nucleotide-binding universal stress UspA family protein